MYDKFEDESMTKSIIGEKEKIISVIIFTLNIVRIEYFDKKGDVCI